jgi:hypothetical protein
LAKSRSMLCLDSGQGKFRFKIQRSSGPRGNQATDGADSGARELWCQEKRLQDIVVRLRGTKGFIWEADKVTGQVRLHWQQLKRIRKSRRVILRIRK